MSLSFLFFIELNQTFSTDYTIFGQRKKAFSGGKRPHTVFCKKTLENLRAGRIIVAER